ncbi:MAG: hypothetical protein ACREBR_03240 [bacterium]
MPLVKQASYNAVHWSTATCWLDRLLVGDWLASAKLNGPTRGGEFKRSMSSLQLI